MPQGGTLSTPVRWGCSRPGMVGSACVETPQSNRQRLVRRWRACDTSPNVTLRTATPARRLAEPILGLLWTFTVVGVLPPTTLATDRPQTCQIWRATRPYSMEANKVNNYHALVSPLDVPNHHGIVSLKKCCSGCVPVTSSALEKDKTSSPRIGWNT